MYILMELIIAMVIMGIFATSTNSQLSLTQELSRMLEQINKENAFKDIERAIIEYYEINGTIPNNLAELKNYLRISATNGSYENYSLYYDVLSNGNSTFEYDGNSFHIAAIVYKGINQTLESSISGNSLTLATNEEIIGLSSFALNNTKRALTKDKVDICTTTLKTYLAIKPMLGTPIYTLISENYLDPKIAIDNYGQLLEVDLASQVCYSKGYNKVNDNQLVDDIKGI